jgi:glycerophosphoryl diester phosphodiesterase
MKVVAHRGRAGSDAENAIESLSRLPPWVNGVEIDVRRSSDGRCVLMHDPTVDRTTDGSGAVSELAWADIARLRVGEGSVPSLAAYLEAARRHGRDLVLVDVKEDDPGLRAEVVDTVLASSWAHKVVVMVREAAGVAELRARSTALRLGLLNITLESVDQCLLAARRHGAELLLVRFGDANYLANRQVVPKLRREGVSAGASTINTDEALRAARQDGCDVVLTDRSAELSPDWWEST